MSHPTAELSALLDGALPERRADELRRHLAGCPSCSAEHRRLRDALAILRSLPAAPEPSPYFATRLLARLDAEPPPRAGWLSRLLASGGRDRSGHQIDRRAALRWKLAVPATGLAAAALVATLSIREARGREQAMAEHLDMLENYEAVAALDDVASPEDALVVAQLDELEGRR